MKDYIKCDYEFWHYGCKMLNCFLYEFTTHDNFAKLFSFLEYAEIYVHACANTFLWSATNAN